MLIRLIQENAEEALLTALEEYSRNPVGRGMLLCAFSDIPIHVTSEQLIPLVKDKIADHGGEIYFFQDGDVIISWHGKMKEIVDSVVATLVSHYGHHLAGHNPKKIFRFYDCQVHGEDLRLIFRDKLKKLHGQVAERTGVLPEHFSLTQLETMKNALTLRMHRTSPHILIVEDQAFSRNLMTEMLRQRFTCYPARNAHEAIAFYAEHAPDVIFLDIELPDMDGHSLAALFRKHDSHGFIVMVTGNNYPKDVEMARRNQVQGFIIKPFNKQKILDAIGVYSNKRKKNQA